MVCQSQWPRDLRRISAAARLLGMRVRIPQGGGRMSVCCECFVLSGRSLCDGPITRPEESYRLWSDLETSRMKRSWLALGHAPQKNLKVA